MQKPIFTGNTDMCAKRLNLRNQEDKPKDFVEFLHNFTFSFSKQIKKTVSLDICMSAYCHLAV